MQRFAVVQTFLTKAKASMPDPEKPGVFRPLEFSCKFISVSNEPTRREELRRKEKDDGQYAFLDEVLKEVEFKGEFEFVDVDGTILEPLEFVKRNQITCNAAVIAFWDVVGRDVEAKNSKRSR